MKIIRYIVHYIKTGTQAGADLRLRAGSGFRRQAHRSTFSVAADGLGIGPFRIDAAAALPDCAETEEENAHSVPAAGSATYSYHPRWFENTWISLAGPAEEV